MKKSIKRQKNHKELKTTQTSHLYCCILCQFAAASWVSGWTPPTFLFHQDSAFGSMAAWAHGVFFPWSSWVITLRMQVENFFKAWQDDDYNSESTSVILCNTVIFFMDQVAIVTRAQLALNGRAGKAGDRGCTWSLQCRREVCSGTKSAGHFPSTLMTWIAFSQCPDESTYVFSAHINVMLSWYMYLEVKSELLVWLLVIQAKRICKKTFLFHIGSISPQEEEGHA